MSPASYQTAPPRNVWLRLSAIEYITVSEPHMQEAMCFKAQIAEFFIVPTHLHFTAKEGALRWLHTHAPRQREEYTNVQHPPPPHMQHHRRPI